MVISHEMNVHTPWTIIPERNHFFLCSNAKENNINHNFFCFFCFMIKAKNLKLHIAFVHVRKILLFSIFCDCFACHLRDFQLMLFLYSLIILKIFWNFFCFCFLHIIPLILKIFNVLSFRASTSYSFQFNQLR